MSDIVHGLLRLEAGWGDIGSDASSQFRLIDRKASVAIAHTGEQLELRVDIEQTTVAGSRRSIVVLDGRRRFEEPLRGRRTLRFFLTPRRPQIAAVSLSISAGNAALDLFARRGARVRSVSVSKVTEIVRRYESVQLLNGWYYREFEGLRPFRWASDVARIELGQPLPFLDVDLEPAEGFEAVKIAIENAAGRELATLCLNMRSRFRIDLPKETRFPETLTFRSDRANDFSLVDARIRSFRSFAIPPPSDRWEILRRLAEGP